MLLCVCVCARIHVHLIDEEVKVFKSAEFYNQFLEKSVFSFFNVKGSSHGPNPSQNARLLIK